MHVQRFRALTFGGSFEQVPVRCQSCVHDVLSKSFTQVSILHFGGAHASLITEVWPCKRRTWKGLLILIKMRVVWMSCMSGCTRVYASTQ